MKKQIVKMYVNARRGSDMNAGTSPSSPWRHLPRDPKATGLAACARAALVLVFVLTLLGGAASAQTPTVHKVSLAWVASPDADSNPTLAYNVYRATGPCPATGSPTTLARIGSTLAGIVTYADTGVSTAQSYCYIVRASLNGIESVDSNSTGAVIPLAPSSGLTAVAQ